MYILISVSPDCVNSDTQIPNGVDLIRCEMSNDHQSDDEAKFTSDVQKSYPEPNGQAMYLGDRIYV